MNRGVWHGADKGSHDPDAEESILGESKHGSNPSRSTIIDEFIE